MGFTRCLVPLTRRRDPLIGDPSVLLQRNYPKNKHSRKPLSRLHFLAGGSRTSLRPWEDDFWTALR